MKTKMRLSSVAALWLASMPVAAHVDTVPHSHGEDMVAGILLLAGVALASLILGGVMFGGRALARWRDR